MIVGMFFAKDSKKKVPLYEQMVIFAVFIKFRADLFPLYILILGKEYTLPILAGLILLAGFTVLTIGQQLQSAQMLPSRYAIMTISYSSLALAFGAALAYFGFGPIGVVVGVASGML